MPKIGRILKMLIWPGILAALLVAAPALAQASSPDVGLVTKLTGKATYWNKEEKKPAPVQAFMKVRKGDHLKLAKNSALTLLYFAGGRQETWKGPARFVAGEAESVVKGGKNAASPAVKMMPASAIKMIAGAPFLLSRAGATQMPGRAGATPMQEKTPPGRAGAIQTMGAVCRVPPPLPPAEKVRAEITKAEAVYRDLKKKAGFDDFTPELYFLGVLAQYRQYPEMNKILDKMLKKNPGDPALQQLKAWVRAQSLCGG
jgi:hypothetical protein